MTVVTKKSGLPMLVSIVHQSVLKTVFLKALFALIRIAIPSLLGEMLQICLLVVAIQACIITISAKSFAVIVIVILVTVFIAVVQTVGAISDMRAPTVGN